MSSLNSPESPTTPPSRPGGRHQLKRSLTEVTTSPGKHYRPRRDRQQSAYYYYSYLSDDKTPPRLQTRHSIDMPRSEGVTPVMSPDRGRREAVLVQRDSDDKTDSRASREGKLSGEPVEKVAFSTESLRQSLVDLNTFSTDTTRRLDETYYAVLEKMSALQNTVMALKDLAETSRDIQVGFESVAKELESDITNQLHAIGKFEAQQGTIEALQSRIHKGREKIEALAARVDVVRERVEGWERADKAWQETTRKRLFITWTGLSVVFLLIAVLFITLGYGPGGVGPRGDSDGQGGWGNTTSRV